MSVLVAAWCAGGVLMAADSKRSDIGAPDAKLPRVRKIDPVTPWCVMGTGGAGTLGDAVRMFVRSICYYQPPSYDEVVQQSTEALRFMYRRYAERYPQEGQPLVGCLAGVPPGGRPRITVLFSSEQFSPQELPETTPFWVVASDSQRARQVLESLWAPRAAEDPSVAVGWIGTAVELLARENAAIGLPVRVEFIGRDSKRWCAEWSTPT